MSLQEALCHRIDRTARMLRESPLRGDPLAIATDRLEEAMTAALRRRLDDATAALARLEEVRL